MRIIGGSLGGRKFNPPARIPARPTTDLVKESLFNILQHTIDLEAIDVLDLFSGTGNIAYEFASRGASSVVAVEKDALSVKFIRDTCSLLRLEHCEVIAGDALKMLSALAQRRQFDVVFADPPYTLPLMGELPDMVLDAGVLRHGGMLILEHTHNIDFENHDRCFRSKKYGSSFLSFFR